MLEDVNSDQEDDFKNCETYSEVLDTLRDIGDRRKKDPRSHYGGKHGKRYKFFYILQTFYPMVYPFIYLWFVFHYMNLLRVNSDIFALIIKDWTGLKSGFQFKVPGARRHDE